MNDMILEIRHLSKSFGTHEVLRDIDFSVAKGDVTSIIGASGSGKSTLLRCVNLLETPTSGDILYHGESVTDRKVNAAAYRSHVGMVFQSFNLFNNMSVLENCMVGQIKVLKKNKDEARENAMRYLEQVGMAPYINAKPRQISGGQKQRVAIAGVIAMQPRCIVLDEPTAMLDPIGRSEVLRTIRDLNRKKGVTVVLITHHMDEAAQADRLVVMTKGRVIADGPPRQVFQDVEGLRSVGLTVPDTTQLLWELRQEGLDVPLDALSDEECAQALCQLLNAASKKGSQP